MGRSLLSELTAPLLVFLLLIDEVAAPVLLPASFVAFGAEWFLLAEADHIDAASVDGCYRQCILHRDRALIAQRHVIFSGSPLVAMSLDCEVDVGMLAEKEHVGLKSRILIGPQVGLVVIEVNVLNILCEQLFIGRPGRWWWWRRRWLSHCQASSCI